MVKKICTKCNVEKDLCEFIKDKTKKDGLRPNCKVCNRKYFRIKREENPEMMSIKLKQFYQKNPHKRTEYRKNYKKRKQEQRKERRKIDPIFVIVNKMRARLYKYLTKLRITKKNRTFDIIGCSPTELKKHIEKQFTNGMTWENRNKWHIDHIIPLSSAKSQEELFNLCHYTNLQPLWAEDNIKKGNKILLPLN